MKKKSIYIDFAHHGDIAKSIQNRIKNFEGIGKVTTYFDLDKTLIGPNEENWDRVTLDAIKGADIVIPILTNEYLSYLTASIVDEFNSIIDSKNKFLFPILYNPSDWGSFNWVVRSKLIPENGLSMIELDNIQYEKELTRLLKRIKDVIEYSQSKNEPEESNIIKTSKEDVIFISHDHDDADFAELLKLKLEKNEIVGWIDSERLKIGQDWREEIDLGIENSKAIIVIMTPEARKSEYVTYEWAFAWGKGVKIFPIMLKQTQLHPRLESLQYLDFTNRASRPWDDLIESIKDIK